MLDIVILQCQICKSIHRSFYHVFLCYKLYKCKQILGSSVLQMCINWIETISPSISAYIPYFGINVFCYQLSVNTDLVLSLFFQSVQWPPSSPTLPSKICKCVIPLQAVAACVSLCMFCLFSRRLELVRVGRAVHASL